MQPRLGKTGVPRHCFGRDLQLLTARTCGGSQSGEYRRKALDCRKSFANPQSHNSAERNSYALEKRSWINTFRQFPLN
jgi:hypothetical protein